MRMTYTCVLGLCLLCAPALAQQGTHGPIVPIGPAGASDFESIFELDEHGEPIEIEGSADIVALDRNSHITPEKREELQSAIDRWTDRLERTVVENIDLAVTLDTSALNQVDLSDQQHLMYVTEAVNMLNSGGSLTEYLYEEGLLTDAQMQQNRRIVSDFQRGLMMYKGEMAEKQFPNDKDQQLKVTMRNNYVISLRDPWWAYERILESLAKHPDAISETLPENVRQDHSADVDRLHGDNTADAVRMLLSKLDYEQQRALAKLGLKLEGE